MRSVGPEHCALQRVLGQYRWVLNGADEVFVDGLRVLEGDLLPAHCTVRLGARGPKLFLSHGAEAEHPTLRPLTPLRVGAARIGQVAAAMRMNRLAILALFVFMLLAVTGGAFAVQRDRGAVAIEGKPTLASVLREAAPSVYRVMFRTIDGHEYGGATAWVVAPHTLATNVHVAAAFTRLPKTTKMLVRSGGAAPSTFDVASVRLHPGFDTFELLWRWYRPTNGERPGRGRGVSPAGMACDVALLAVSSECELAPPLRLATDEQLLSLQPGTPIGYIGYPSENLALDGSPLRQPNPQIQVGRITALTNDMGEAESAATNHLIQHSCPGTGGASGSPLLDDSGRVVGIVNAGNVTQTAWQRIPSAAGVNFAQRIDLLRELLDRREIEATVRHAAQWKAQLQRLYLSAGAQGRARDRRVALGRAAQRARASAPDADEPVFEPAHEVTFDLRPDPDSHSRIHTMTVPRPGRYVLLVWTYGANDVDLENEVLLGSDSANPPIIVETPMRDVRLYEARFPGAGSWTLRTVAKKEAARVHVEWHRRDDEPVTASDLLTELLAAWEAQMTDTLHVRLEMSLVHQSRLGVGKSWALDDPRVLDRVQLNQPGLYLVCVETPSGVSVCLSSPGDEEDVLPASLAIENVDARPVYVAVPRTLFVWAKVDPDAPETTKVELRIYRARPMR